MKSFSKTVTIKKLNNLSWFDYSNIDNCDSMTGNEILGSFASVSYDKETDVCKCEFIGGGRIFDFSYRSGSEFDKECIEQLAKL